MIQFFFRTEKSVRMFSHVFCVFLLLLMTGCSGGGDGSSSDFMSESENPESETGTIAFTIENPEQAARKSGISGLVSGTADMLGPRSAMAGFTDDCDTDIVEISALVYDEFNAEMLSAGPWKCSAHSGKIGGVRPGSDRKLVLLAKNDKGHITYRTEAGGITVTGGQTSEVAIAGFQSFVPVLTGNNDFLEWQQVSGAASYRIEIKKESSNSIVKEDTVICYASPCSLKIERYTDTHYALAYAIDVYGNQSSESERYIISALTVWYKDADGDKYSDGTTLTAVERPQGYYAQSELTGVSGDCDDDNAGRNPGTAEICGDGIDQDCDGSDETCTADSYTLTIVKSGTGDGTVIDNFNSIACGTLCSSSYPNGTQVILSVLADQDSVFGGWSGSGCTGTGNCTVIMNTNQTVTASFNINANNVDEDGDGFTVSQGDCDDSNADKYPGNTEICGDGIDQDCNNDIDDGCTIPPIIESINYQWINCAVGDELCSGQTGGYKKLLQLEIHYNDPDGDMHTVDKWGIIYVDFLDQNVDLGSPCGGAAWTTSNFGQLTFSGNANEGSVTAIIFKSGWECTTSLEFNIYLYDKNRNRSDAYHLVVP